MKRILSVACLLFLGAAAAQAQDYFRQYGNEPMQVINQTTDPSSTEVLTLVGLDRGDLILRIPNRKGEVGIPLKSENLKLKIQYPDDVALGLRNIESGEYEEAIPRLRPSVYAVIKYFDIPAESMNVHEIINQYLIALNNAPGHDEEISGLIRRIPLDTAPPIFSVRALEFVTRLVELGKQDEALNLLNRIPMEADNEAMLDLVMDFAGQLREEGNLDEAQFLYDRLQQSKGTEQAQIAVLWSAYCNVALGRAQLAGIFVDKAGNLKPDDRAYSLAQLVKARIMLDSLNYTAAMEEAAQGVVGVDVGYSWAPELIFVAGLCYENLDYPDTAREVYNEIILFWPENKWAQESQKGLIRLPPPSPKEEAPSGA
ncbi:tetratricopeptide repeat protein [Cerasicoccus fimbriatus]|uniref:tetratricopeptide repeat protein n=1 Tax=Cerasicoccus fimbriatus TaxID=3014554 RepID=UPI0022B5B03E|nr:hypothetical protein [Cerasicoccus sp. TK19100]